jgi:hypothetical protein
MLRWIFGASLLAGASWAVLASAQNLAPDQTESQFARDRNVGVLERPRADYDALGVRAGGFLVFPKIELSGTYETNIFAAQTNALSDFVVSIAPSINVQSQWSTHSLNLFAKTDIYEYAKYNSQSNFTYSVGGNGRFDVLRTTYLTGAADFSHLVQPRSDASTPQSAAKPISYDQIHADIGGVHEVNRIRLSGNLTFYNYSYANNHTTLGAPINETYRNENTILEVVRADYALSPSLAIFATVQHNDRSYLNPPRPGDVRRNSSGFEGDIGADFEITQLMRGQVQVGYLSQSYQDHRVGTASGVGARGEVEYFPTQLLTIKGNVERTVADAGVIGSPTFFHTGGGAEVDYEFLRNLVLIGRVRDWSDDYQGIARTDGTFEGRIGANYLFSRLLGFNLSYDYFNRTSKGAARGPSFSDNRFQIGVVVQY